MYFGKKLQCSFNLNKSKKKGSKEAGEIPAERRLIWDEGLELTLKR